MNLQQIQYFKVIAELEHYTRAAEKLLISQPSLSYAMSELERELGAPLFRKVGRGVTLPLRYNNDKRKKPLFSRGLSVCRHLFNSFSKLKCDEKIIEKRRLFH